MAGVLTAGGEFTSTQLVTALTATTRTWRFRFDLLDDDGNVLGEVETVEGSAKVEYADFADVQRTGDFTIRGTSDVNFATDRLRPVAELAMPGGGWAGWPLGVFLLASPTSTRTYRSEPAAKPVTAYDRGLILRDDKLLARHTVPAGARYVDAAGAVLDSVGLPKSGLSADDRVLKAAMEWEPGTMKLQVINDLLSAINYRPLYFDGNGLGIGVPYRAPGEAAILWEYVPGPRSTLRPGMEETLDLLSVPNAWVAVVSEAEAEPLVATYVNVSPTSPTSTVNVGRTIVDYREGEQAADLTTLQAKVMRYAQEASQVYAQTTWSTALMPFHEAGDVVILDTDTGQFRYRETGWSITLQAGAEMTHKARRVVLL